MLIKLNNITFQYSDGQFDQYSGEALYTIPKKALQDCVQSFDGGSYLLSELDDALEDQSEYDEIQLHNTDALIGFCEWFIENRSDETVTIQAEYDHVIWLFHDAAHIQWHCTDFDIYVDESSEIQAVEYSIDKLVEHDIAIPIHILQQTDKEYKERFKAESYFTEYAKKHAIKLPEIITL